MKIIDQSNHDLKTVSDVLIEENLTFGRAVDKAARRNENRDHTAKYWAVVVPDDYKLHIYNPE